MSEQTIDFQDLTLIDEMMDDFILLYHKYDLKDGQLDLIIQSIVEFRSRWASNEFEMQKSYIILYEEFQKHNPDIDWIATYEEFNTKEERDTRLAIMKQYDSHFRNISILEAIKKPSDWRLNI